MTSVFAADTKYLSHNGVETDLTFNRGVDLPNFALYPLLETEAGRTWLRSYVDEQINIAARYGMGAIVETATWKANARRAAPLGHDGAGLDQINKAAVALVAEASHDSEIPVVISGCIGPQDDAYSPAAQLSRDAARGYHSRQIETLARAGADLIGAYTLAYVSEAAGMALAARDAGIPVMISFTLETDGTLPDGTSLGDAITACDDQTDGAPAHYMINCAHPEHFSHILGEAPWMDRLKGLVVNASRCSHAELDEAEELDDGNPQELGIQVARLAQAFPNLQIFGGCCGTDARHLGQMGQALATLT